MSKVEHPDLIWPLRVEEVEDAAHWVLRVAGCAVAASLAIRTSREISRRARSSVLLDSPLVMAKRNVAYPLPRNLPIRAQISL